LLAGNSRQRYYVGKIIAAVLPVSIAGAVHVSQGRLRRRFSDFPVAPLACK